MRRADGEEKHRRRVCRARNAGRCERRRRGVDEETGVGGDRVGDKRARAASGGGERVLRARGATTEREGYRRDRDLRARRDNAIDRTSVARAPASAAYVRALYVRLYALN